MDVNKKPLTHIHKMLMRGSALSVSVVFPLILTSIIAHADQTVTSGSTVPQISLADGETLTVEQGGAVIDAANNAVIDTAGGTIYVNNAGQIDASANDGINATGATLGLLNTGNITAGQTGVQASTITLLQNEGTISTNSSSVQAINIENLINSGNIMGTFGVSASGDLDSLQNSGIILGTAGDGIRTTATIGNISNSHIIFGMDNGIETLGTLSNLTNSGSISSVNSAIVANIIGQITNSGRIASDADGINANTLSNLINSGTISGTNNGLNVNTITNLINSGTISSMNDAVDVGIISSLINSGTISGEGAGVGVTTLSNLINSGVISGGTGNGFSAFDASSLTNSGTISGAVGVELSIGGGNSIIANSGTIEGTSGIAIDLQSADADTLNLLPGSILRGSVDMVGANDTINFGTGLSAVVNLGGTEPGTTNFSSPINYSDATTRVQGDISYLNAVDDLLEGVSGGITSAVKTRLGTAKYSRVQTDGDGFGYIKDGDLAKSFWASGWASTKNIGTSSFFAPTYYTAGGSVLGIDRAEVDGEVTGLYGGAGFGRLGVDVKRGQTIDTQNFYGGAYGQRNIGAGALNFNILGGWMQFDSDRAVDDETAQANFNGWFFAPTIGYEQELELAGQQLSASGSIGYAGMFVESYTETGSSSNLTVGAQNIHQLNARGEISWLKHYDKVEGAPINYAPYFGFEARSNFGSTTGTVSMLGNTATFDADGESFIARAFVGGTFSKAISETADVFGRLEASYDTSNSSQFNAQLGFSVKF